MGTTYSQIETNNWIFTKGFKPLHLVLKCYSIMFFASKQVGPYIDEFKTCLSSPCMCDQRLISCSVFTARQWCRCYFRVIRSLVNDCCRRLPQRITYLRYRPYPWWQCSGDLLIDGFAIGLQLLLSLGTLSKYCMKSVSLPLIIMEKDLLKCVIRWIGIIHHSLWSVLHTFTWTPALCCIQHLPGAFGIPLHQTTNPCSEKSLCLS